MTSAGCCGSSAAQRLPGLDLLQSELTPVNPASQSFPEAWWDADAFALAVSVEFWRSDWKEAITVNPPDNSSEHIIQELTELKNLSPAETNARLDEILVQDRDLSAYFERLLMIAPPSHAATLRLIRSSLRVAEMLAMYYKLKFARPRPQQFSPGLTPLIAPPTTPSYPGRHALQAALTARVLSQVMPPRYHALLDALAARAAENRLYARVNIKSDNEAAQRIAAQAEPKLNQIPTIRNLIEKSRIEIQSAGNYV